MQEKGQVVTRLPLFFSACTKGWSRKRGKFDFLSFANIMKNEKRERRKRRKKNHAGKGRRKNGRKA